MRREVPLFITFLTGTVIIIGFFVPHKPLGEIEQTFINWSIIIGGFTLLLGLDSLLKLHIRKIKRREGGYAYSIILVASFLITLIVGIFSIIKYKSILTVQAPFMFIYTNVILPLSSTMFSLLAFFIASAAYRAFRARNIDAVLLLVAGALVMLGRVPIGAMISKWLPATQEWIMHIPQMAAKRGLFIGIALGGMAMSLRIILGIERTYLQ